MDALAKTLLLGKWKSFKLFERTGDIKLSTTENFKQFHFSNDGLLTIKNHMGSRSEQVAHTDQWTIEFKDKNYYLKLPFYKLSYEVITVNHTVLVLRDLIDSEKIFLCREVHWSNYLQSNARINL